MCGRCGCGSAVFVDDDADDTVVDIAVVVREQATAVGLKGPPRANLWQVRCVDVVGVVCAVVWDRLGKSRHGAAGCARR